MHEIPLRSLCALGLLGAAPLAGQGTLSFPLERDGVHAATGAAVLRPDAVSIQLLTRESAVVLQDLVLPSGESVDLALTRLPVEALGFGFQVDGQPAPGLLDGLDLSVWKGRVVGSDASEVILSFSHAGSRGFVTHRGVVTNLMPQPGEGNDWSRGYSVLIESRELVALGAKLDFDCGVEQLSNYQPFGDAMPTVDATVPAPPGGSVLYECKMAVETDYELNQLFGGDLGAETAYVTTLLAAGSDRYVEQLDTVLTYPYVQFYTTSSDPWSTPGSGGSIDMLNEFVAAWGGAPLPGDAQLGHFLSGASLGGGVAYLGVLCDSAHDFSFGVSGNIDGLVPFPVAQGPLNWDFVVFTHEVGHNFSSPHTHDYCPPIDECAPSGYWGGCQDEQACISDGSIMGYCHLCSGGLANVTTFFHPDVVTYVTPHIEACLPTAAGIEALPPAIIAPDVATTLSATVTGTPVGSVDLNYRFDGGPFQVVGMSHQGGGVYEGDLPAADCSDAPEFYFSTIESLLGPVQTDVFTAVVGNQSFLFADDFQSDLGWSVGDGDDDATTGVWERVDPNPTSAQPDSGIDVGTGPLCFVTGQGSPGGSVGENDVDDGKTTLFSPVFDLSGGNATISYYRWYSNNAGSTPNTDIFTVDVSNGGAWENVETIGPAGAGTGGGWVYHEFEVDDFVTPNATVQVRFVASDEGDGSIVEAAIDEFDVFQLDCEVCQPDLGFGGPGSVVLSVCGEELASGNSATLSISGAPASSATLLVWSTVNNPLAVEGGTLVPNPVEGFLVDVTGGSGDLNLNVPGGGNVTLYVQALVYDAGAGQLLFSNAVESVFLP